MPPTTRDKADEERAEVVAQSDDAPEAEQLPVLDVDVADVPDKKFKGESPPLVLAGYWARLAVHEDVPERFQGHIAAILESPWTSSPYANDEQAAAIAGYRYDKDKLFLVRTRDEADATLELPFEAFSEVSDSRATLSAHA